MTMKKLNMILLIASAACLLLPLYGRAGDCEKLGKDADKLKKEVEKLADEAEKRKGEADDAAADRSAAERNLADYLNNPSAHGPADQVRRRTRELQDALKRAQDNLRKKQSEYFDKLGELKKKQQEWLDKLAERRKKCGEEGKDDVVPGIEQDLRENKDKPGQTQEKMDEMTDAETGRYDEELKKKEGESEQDYQRRLTKLYEDLLKKKMGKQEKYWKDDFWQKVLEKVIEKIKQKLKESEERTGGASQGALPRDNNREREYVFGEPRFTGGFIAGFPAPYKLPDEFTRSVMEDLGQSVYENPETWGKLSESLGGEFFFGHFSGPGEFTNRQAHSGFLYGVQGGVNLTGRLDLIGRASRWRQYRSAEFPVQVIDSEKGESRSVTGQLTQNSRIFSLDAILRHRFGNGRLQPFAGAGFSFFRARIQPGTAEVAGIGWQVGEGGKSSGSAVIGQGGVRWLLSSHMALSGELNARMYRGDARFSGLCGLHFNF